MYVANPILRTNRVLNDPPLVGGGEARQFFATDGYGVGGGVDMGEIVFEDNSVSDRGVSSASDGVGRGKAC